MASQPFLVYIRVWICFCTIILYSIYLIKKWVTPVTDMDFVCGERLFHVNDIVTGCLDGYQPVTVGCYWSNRIGNSMICSGRVFPIAVSHCVPTYSRVYACIYVYSVPFSLSIIFSIVIGNIRNRCKESLEWLKFLCFRGSCWFASIETVGNEFMFPGRSLLFPIGNNAVGGCLP